MTEKLIETIKFRTKNKPLNDQIKKDLNEEVVATNKNFKSSFINKFNKRYIPQKIKDSSTSLQIMDFLLDQDIIDSMEFPDDRTIVVNFNKTYIDYFNQYAFAFFEIMLKRSVSTSLIKKRMKKDLKKYIEVEEMPNG